MTTSVTDRTDLQSRLHGMWASVAGAWGEHAEFTDARAANVRELMLDGAGIRPGDRVLELACGAGGVGLAAARRVAPGGAVLMSDVVPEMTAIAAARAAGVAGVRTRVLDLERIAEPDGGFDAVLCAEGLMFAVDPTRAAREIHRVLRPGGRVALTVWGPRERNPWLGLVFDAVSAQIGRPVPPPGIPGPFALGDSDGLAALLRAAGLVDVEVREVAVPLHADSFDEWWRRTSALAGPLSAILAALPDEELAAIRSRLLATVGIYETPNGLDLPGHALLATARRAALGES